MKIKNCLFYITFLLVVTVFAFHNRTVLATDLSKTTLGPVSEGDQIAILEVNPGESKRITVLLLDEDSLSEEDKNDGTIIFYEVEATNSSRFTTFTSPDSPLMSYYCTSSITAYGYLGNSLWTWTSQQAYTPTMMGIVILNDFWYFNSIHYPGWTLDSTLYSPIGNGTATAVVTSTGRYKYLGGVQKVAGVNKLTMSHTGSCTVSSWIANW
jgi:hypothetical protein